jgi:hypothetical protein
VKILTDFRALGKDYPNTDGFITGPNDIFSKSVCDPVCKVAINISDNVNTTRYLLLDNIFMISALPVLLIFFVHEKSGDIS